MLYSDLFLTFDLKQLTYIQCVGRPYHSTCRPANFGNSRCRNNMLQGYRMSGIRQLLARWFSCKRVAPPTVLWCCYCCYYCCYCCCYCHYCHCRYHCYHYCYRYFQKSSRYFQRSSHCSHSCCCCHYLPRSHTVFDPCYCILWCSPRNMWLLRRESVAAVDDVADVPSWWLLSCCLESFQCQCQDE
jgi:hypothetical protein